MGPLRILILAVLLYIGYRLIAANLRKNREAEDDDGREQVSDASVTDVLVEDPVCHKLVPKGQAKQLEVGDEVHYFCSSECHDEFVEQQRGDEGREA